MTLPNVRNNRRRDARENPQTRPRNPPPVRARLPIDDRRTVTTPPPSANSADALRRRYEGRNVALLPLNDGYDNPRGEICAVDKPTSTDGGEGGACPLRATPSGALAATAKPIA